MLLFTAELLRRGTDSQGTQLGETLPPAELMRRELYPSGFALLPPSQWPRTVAEATIDAVRHLSDENIDYLRSGFMNDDSFPSWEPWIRSRYGLWQGNQALLTDGLSPEACVAEILHRVCLLQLGLDLSELSSLPQTVDAAAYDLLDSLDDKEFDLFCSLAKESLGGLHFGLGADVRSRYRLWSGNDALLFAAFGYEGDPDSAARPIIERAWEIAQQRER